MTCVDQSPTSVCPLPCSILPLSPPLVPYCPLPPSSSSPLDRKNKPTSSAPGPHEAPVGLCSGHSTVQSNPVRAPSLGCTHARRSSTSDRWGPHFERGREEDKLSYARNRASAFGLRGGRRTTRGRGDPACAFRIAAVLMREQSARWKLCTAGFRLVASPGTALLTFCLFSFYLSFQPTSPTANQIVASGLGAVRHPRRE
jgi:hypothetical protein